jgi:hypothetical protein
LTSESETKVAEEPSEVTNTFPRFASSVQPGGLGSPPYRASRSSYSVPSGPTKVSLASAFR